MIDTVIFDMDGTLLDTLEDLKDAVNEGLSVKGYPARSLEEIRQFVGNGVGVLLRNAVPEGTSEADMEVCLEAFKAHYAKHWQDKTKPYDGILQLLADLKASGKKTAVISNKYDEAVVQLCKDYFPELFDAARGERAGVPRKPAPDGILLHSGRIGFCKRTCGICRRLGSGYGDREERGACFRRCDLGIPGPGTAGGKRSGLYYRISRSAA